MNKEQLLKELSEAKQKLSSIEQQIKEADKLDLFMAEHKKTLWYAIYEHGGEVSNN